jgi:hypothetical protein
MPIIQIPRSHQLKVTLTPEMHARLSGLAERFGQTPATLASVALGHYVTTQEATLGAPQKMVDTMLSQLMPQIQAQIEQASEVQLELPSLENRGPTSVGVGS